MPPDFVQQRRETGSGAIRIFLTVEICTEFISVTNQDFKMHYKNYNSMIYLPDKRIRIFP